MLLPQASCAQGKQAGLQEVIICRCNFCPLKFFCDFLVEKHMRTCRASLHVIFMRAWKKCDALPRDISHAFLPFFFLFYHIVSYPPHCLGFPAGAFISKVEPVSYHFPLPWTNILSDHLYKWCFIQKTRSNSNFLDPPKPPTQTTT